MTVLLNITPPVHIWACGAQIQRFVPEVEVLHARQADAPHDAGGVLHGAPCNSVGSRWIWASRARL